MATPDISSSTINFHTSKKNPLNNIRNINKQILSHGEVQSNQMFLYGHPKSNLTNNRLYHKLNKRISKINKKIQVPSFQLTYFLSCNAFSLVIFSITSLSLLGY